MQINQGTVEKNSNENTKREIILERWKIFLAAIIIRRRPTLALIQMFSRAWNVLWKKLLLNEQEKEYQWGEELGCWNEKGRLMIKEDEC